MLVRASSFTDDYEYPAPMPFGRRCGAATDANAVVLTTTDTGPSG